MLLANENFPRPGIESTEKIFDLKFNLKDYNSTAINSLPKMCIAVSIFFT